MPTLSAPVVDTPSLLTSLTPRRPPQFIRYEPSRVVGEMSVEQYLSFEDQSEEKHDYVFGKVVQVAGANLEHLRITSNLNIALGVLVDEVRAAAEVFGSDTRVLVGGSLYRYPDLVIVEDDPDMGLNKTLRNPLVLIEVLSDSTQDDDRTDKFFEYQQIQSLRYYVLVEQHRVGVTVYGKQDNGLWAIFGRHTDLDDTLTLTVGGGQITVALARIYRRVFEVEAVTSGGTDTEVL